MKYAIIIGDGMADYPLEELGGRTPLQVADTPSMDWIAANGRSGLLVNIPREMPADSGVAVMSILGHNPKKYYTGRGPLEAAGMDIELGEVDIAFRCNLITEEDGVIKDYSAGHVSTEEAENLVKAIKEEYGEIGDFYVGIDYRHLFILRNPGSEAEKLQSKAPHHIVGEKFEENLIEPKGLEIARTLNEMIIGSRKILSNHSVNKERENRGENSANAIWLWGQGKKPALESMVKKYGVEGAVISAVTIVKGIGARAGMDKIDVPGATGYYDTNYENKAEYGLKALEDHDLILIHVEAPDEAGHAGDVEKKIETIEDLDQRLVKKILDNMGDEFTISILPDHPTPIEVGDHVPEPVPFSVYSTKGRKDDVGSFDEFSASNGSIGTLEGYKFMDGLILGTW